MASAAKRADRMTSEGEVLATVGGNVGAIAAVTRDFRGQAHVKIKGKDEALVVSRIYSHLFKQM